MQDHKRENQVKAPVTRDTVKIDLTYINKEEDGQLQRSEIDEEEPKLIKEPSREGLIQEDWWKARKDQSNLGGSLGRNKKEKAKEDLEKVYGGSFGRKKR